MSNEVIAPTVHLNGTSAEALVEGYLSACGKVRDALEALDECSPNARDYSPSTFAAAVAQHVEHIRALTAVRDALYQLAENVQDQADARAK